MTGRMYPEGWAKLSALVIFLGFNLTFFPQFILGYLGMPRRYHVYPDEFQVLHVLSTAGASVLAVGYLMPMIYFIWSLRYGAGGAAPIRGAPPGLEWKTPSPPPLHNFDETPVVTHEAYDYSTVIGRGDRSWLDHAHVGNARAARAVRYRRAAEGRLHAGDVDLPHHRNHVLRRHVPGLHRLPHAVLRRSSRWPAARLNVYIGAANTAVLLCSSFTMVLAVRAAQLGQRKAIVLFLILTLILGGVFLGVKAYEWNEKFVEHHVPGPSFHLEGVSPDQQGHAQLFFSLYFAMTGLHALHMVIGAGIADVPAYRQPCKGKYTRGLHTRRWISSASTGTSSISSGFSCSRCST